MATVAPAPVRTRCRRAVATMPQVTAEQRSVYEAILRAAAARQRLTGDAATAMAAMEVIGVAAVLEASRR